MIHFNNVSKQYGSRILYRNASFQIRPGSKTGLVGPNGAGKSTIFRIITGAEDVDSGDVSIPSRIVIGSFSQDVGEMKGRTALEEVKAGSGRVDALAQELASYEKQLEDLAENPMSDDDMATLLEKYGEAQQEFERRGGYDLDHRAQEILTGLGIPPEDHRRSVEAFSGGWKMRIELAKILALNPDVLLMDEPTNHLDVESIVWLEEWLVNFKGALVMTSHDRDFMNRIVTRIVEVANQSITTYTGNYDFYERERDVRKEQLVAAHARQQEMLAKEEEFIARFAARASHAAQVNSRVKKLEKIDRIEIPAEEKTVRFEFKAPPRSGEEVVIMEGLGKAWKREDGGDKVVFDNVTGILRRLSRVALVGVNGAGKSTLMKCIVGATEPSKGKVRLGAGVELGYFSQHALDVLDARRTMFETVRDAMPHASVGVVKTLLGAFLFSDDEVDKKIGVLSGGEKSRVVLATIFARPVNFLVLDEPTNHLDIRSREVLLETLRRFEGTILLVSHDRYFLRALVNRVFEVGHGDLRTYEGNYEYYLEKSAALAMKA
ncbi:MAG: ABC-F family ATP-binding cassette domain-containing protein [Silvanigrellales bacterium]|nr:ABC-F family ATP-binding cassette domain-containing protein [Silvanigrellales bacterium]